MAMILMGYFLSSRLPYAFYAMFMVLSSSESEVSHGSVACAKGYFCARPTTGCILGLVEKKIFLKNQIWD